LLFENEFIGHVKLYISTFYGVLCIMVAQRTLPYPPPFDRGLIEIESHSLDPNIRPLQKISQGVIHSRNNLYSRDGDHDFRRVRLFALCHMYCLPLPSALLPLTWALLLVTPLPLPGTGYHFCLPQGLPPWISYLYLPVLGFEALLLALTLVVSVGHIRRMVQVGQWSRKSIITTLVRDSVFYFLL
jgi:hypothetical protein